MNVMLLAAGRSTRLGELGLALPKPLAPVCGYPAIRFGLHAAARAGARRAVVNVHHRGDLLRCVVGDGKGWGIEVVYSIENELLGTGGGLAQARPLFEAGPVLVMNAKVVAELNLSGLWAAHAHGGGVATLLLRDDPDPRRWGAIASDATGRVVAILDARSPRPPQGPVTERMFTGVHVVEPALLDRLKPVVCDVIRDAYIPALLAGATIRAAPHTGYFAEHSTPARYLEGNLALLRDPGLLSHPPGPLTGVDATATIGVGARIAPPCRIDTGADIGAGAIVGPDVVVASAARVAAGAHLQRAVVWPGATATGDITDAVVTPTGVVRV